jgi:hypothetical protein
MKLRAERQVDNNSSKIVKAGGLAVFLCATLAGCGNTLSPNVTSSREISVCGANYATASTGKKIAPLYTGLVDQARKEAAILYSRTQKNDGSIVFDANNSDELLSTPNTLDISWDDNGQNTNDTVGYDVTLGISKDNKPNVGLGMLACNDGGTVYVTAFDQRLANYVALSTDLP